MSELPQITITCIREIKLAKVSDTGRNMLLHMVAHDGKEFAVQIPVDELPKLLDWSVTGFSQALKRSGRPATDRLCYELKEVQVGDPKSAPEANMVVLSLRWGEEGWISYWMPRYMTEFVGAALDTELKAEDRHKSPPH